MNKEELARADLEKTAKLRASCGSSGIEIRVSPRVISGGFFFATAARGLSTIAATRAGQSQGQATKVAMLGSLDYVTRQLIVYTSPTKRSAY